jgi:TPR repeat protein
MGFSFTGAACAVLGVFVTIGCSGSAASGLRPDTQTASGATGEDSCRVINDRDSPLVIDWKAHERSSLEEAMHDGVAVVAYDCHRLRLLRNCTAKGTYEFFSTGRKEAVLELKDSDAVRASFPTAGVALAQKFHAEMERGMTLDLATVLVGKQRTSFDSLTPAQLTGDCEDATHFVHATFVGAYALGTGTRARVAAAASIFSGEASSDELRGVREGDPARCVARAQGEPGPEGCMAPIRLELIRIGAKPATATSDEPAACPVGLVRGASGCVAPSKPKGSCNPTDVIDCSSRCDQGDGDACFASGRLLESPKKLNLVNAVQRYRVGCERGSMAACARFAYFEESGWNVPANDADALALYKKACAAGEGAGCSGQGTMLAKGFGGARDVAAGVALFRRACDLGSASGCRKLAESHWSGAGVSQDDARAAQLFDRACSAGDLDACVGRARALETGRGTTKDETSALLLLRRSCDAESLPACLALFDAYQRKVAVGADPPGLAKTYTTACEGSRDGAACRNLALLVLHDESRMNVGPKPTGWYLAPKYAYEACNREDRIGCYARSLLNERGHFVSTLVADVPEGYRRACAAGEALACGAYSRVLRTTPKGVDRAALFRIGCRAGNDADCSSLAALGGAR